GRRWPRRDAHQARGRGPDLLEPFRGGAIGIYRGRRLGAGEADVAGADEHQGIRGVYQRGLDAIDDVARRAGPPQAAGHGATRIEEVQRDARAAPGDARQLEVALDGRLAVLHRNVGDDDLLRVGVVDLHDGLAVRRGRHQLLVDREGPDRGRAVATVAR